MSRILILSLLAATMLSACASETPAREEKKAEAQTKGVDRKARDAIGREDTLSQMTFWAKENSQFPEDPEVALKFAESLRKGGRAERAVEVASEALQKHQDDRELLRTLGLSLIASGRSGEALQPLMILADGDMQDWRAFSALGVALDDVGRVEEARNAYREALKIKPDEPGVLTNLGVSYLLTGNAVEAESVLRQAAVLPGATPETRQNLAIAIGLQGRFGEAEQLQRVDLPPALVANNMAYLRGLITDDRRWDDLRGVRQQ